MQVVQIGFSARRAGFLPSWRLSNPPPKLLQFISFGVLSTQLFAKTHFFCLFWRFIQLFLIPLPAQIINDYWTCRPANQPVWNKICPVWVCHYFRRGQEDEKPHGSLCPWSEDTPRHSPYLDYPIRTLQERVFCQHQLSDKNGRPVFLTFIILSEKPHLLSPCLVSLHVKTDTFPHKWLLYYGSPTSCFISALRRRSLYRSHLRPTSWPKQIRAKQPNRFQVLHFSFTITQKVLKIKPISYRKLCLSTYSKYSLIFSCMMTSM